MSATSQNQVCAQVAGNGRSDQAPLWRLRRRQGAPAFAVRRRSVGEPTRAGRQPARMVRPCGYVNGGWARGLAAAQGADGACIPSAARFVHPALSAVTDLLRPEVRRVSCLGSPSAGRPAAERSRTRRPGSARSGAAGSAAPPRMEEPLRGRPAHAAVRLRGAGTAMCAGGVPLRRGPRSTAWRRSLKSFSFTMAL